MHYLKFEPPAPNLNPTPTLTLQAPVATPNPTQPIPAPQSLAPASFSPPTKNKKLLSLQRPQTQPPLI